MLPFTCLIRCSAADDEPRDKGTRKHTAMKSSHTENIQINGYSVALGGISMTHLPSGLLITYSIIMLPSTPLTRSPFVPRKMNSLVPRDINRGVEQIPKMCKGRFLIAPITADLCQLYYTTSVPSLGVHWVHLFCCRTRRPFSRLATIALVLQMKTYISA